jgi:hypothetical protein
VIQRAQHGPCESASEKQAGDGAQGRYFCDRVCRNWMRHSWRLRVIRVQPIGGRAVERGLEVEALFVGFAEIVSKVVDRA